MLNFFFGFQGRIRRTHFFFGVLITGLVSSMFGAHWLSSHHFGWHYDAFDDEWTNWSLPPGLGLVAAVVGIGCFWAKLAIAAKRFHDTGASAWLTLLFVIPVVDFILFVILCLIPPTRGPNQYGDDPRLGATPAALA